MHLLDVVVEPETAAADLLSQPEVAWGVAIALAIILTIVIIKKR